MPKKPERLSVGQRFGKLEIIGDLVRIGPPGNRLAGYPVRCDCGMVRDLLLGSIQNGQTSCGCGKGAWKDSKAKNLTPGDRFGKLEVVGPPTMVAESNNRRTAYLMRCECGNEKLVTAHNLLCGGVKSCGCIYEYHGEAGGRLYNIWAKIKQRCNPDANSTHTKQYADRGIRVSPEWNGSFLAFKEWAEGNGYAADLTIERVDVNGNYEPTNCTWIPLNEQSKKRTSTLYMKAFGEIKTIADWSRDSRCKTNYYALRARYLNCGWQPERAITSPNRK